MKDHTVTLPLADFEEMRTQARIGSAAVEWWKWRKSCPLNLDAEDLESEMVRAGVDGKRIHLNAINEAHSKIRIADSL